MSLVPEVSVVIPTIGRPSLDAAIRSALDQTKRVLEVIVASDSEEPLGVAEHYGDRVREVHVGPRAGGNVARNAGIRLSRGKLIALLDDDDTWTPEKLAKQLRASYVLLDSSGSADWISATLIRNETTKSSFPTRVPSAHEALIDYLFAMKRFRKGAMVTSTLLFPKALAIAVPFDEALKFHQDIDWLIDVNQKIAQLKWQVVPEVLTISGDTPASVSKKIDVAPSLAWARRRLADQRGTAYADFLLTRMPMTKAVRLGPSAIRSVVTELLGSRRIPSATAVLYSAALVARGQLTRIRAHRSIRGTR